MSYNIDKWKTKRLDNLTIPLDAFFKHPRTDWHPKQCWHGTEDFKLESGGGQEIKGTLKDGHLTVTEIDMTGEGSGTFYNWILQPALEASKGTLEAVLVWEGGDSINRLIVEDGVVKSEDIDL
jgi:hypothetical protein